MKSLADKILEIASQMQTIYSAGYIKGYNETGSGAALKIVNIEESDEDGGNNIITFSDGSTLTVKNGNKGSKGEQGVQGADCGLTVDSEVSHTSDNPVSSKGVVNYVGYVFDEFPTETEIQSLPNKSYLFVRGTGVYSNAKVADEEFTVYFRTTSWRPNALTFTDTDGATIYVVPINQPVGELYMPSYGIKTGEENAEKNSAIMSELSASAAYGSIFKFPVGNFYFSEPIDISSKHISVIGTTDTNHKNDDKLGVTFLHFTDLAEGETALTVTQCTLADFVIYGTSDQYSFSVVRENAYTDISTVNQETIGVKAYGVKTTGGMLIRNVGFKYFYTGCYCNNSNVFIDNITFHSCHYGLSLGTDIKVNTISGANVMVLLQLRGSLCSAVGVRGDSIGQHLVEIVGGSNHTLVDLDADFCMDAIVAIDGNVEDIIINGVHGRSGVRHFYKTGDSEITANNITSDTVGEYGVVTVKDGSTLYGAYILANQSSGVDSNPFDETIGTDTTYEVPFVLMSAGAGTTVKGVQFVTTTYDEELTEEWVKKRIASLSSIANGCYVKVQTSKGSIVYGRDASGLVYVTDEATELYKKMDFSSFALDAVTVKSVNGNYPDDDGNVVVEEEEPEVVNYTLEELTAKGDTAKKYVLDDGYIYAYRKRFVAGTTTPNFTNQLPLALNPVTESEILNGVGYKDNAYYCIEDGVLTEYGEYVHSGGTESISNRWSTGLIPVKNGDVVRINNARINRTSGAPFVHLIVDYNDTLNCGHLRGYDFVGSSSKDPDTDVVDKVTFNSSIQDDYSATLSDVVMPVESYIHWSMDYGGEAKYLILFCDDDDNITPENMIVTVNEEITYTVTEDKWVWEWVNTGEQYYAVDYLGMIEALEQRVLKLENTLAE